MIIPDLLLLIFTVLFIGGVAIAYHIVGRNLVAKHQRWIASQIKPPGNSS